MWETPWGLRNNFFFPLKKNLRQVGQRPESLLHSMCSVLRWEASWVGWLVLCVHLAGPGFPVRWSNIILDVSVEGVFGWDGHWKKADSEYSRFPSSCGRALSSQGKASIDLKICLLYVRRNSPAGCLWTSSAILALPSSSKDCLWIQTTTVSYVGRPLQSDFGLANSLESYVPTSYNKSVFINIYLHIYLSTYLLSRFPWWLSD